MSKTPRTDAAILQYFYGEINHGGKSYLGQMARADKMEELETELADMRTIFVSYILSEEAWRESKKDPTPMLIEANFVREKAKETLGL